MHHGSKGRPDPDRTAREMSMKRRVKPRNKVNMQAVTLEMAYRALLASSRKVRAPIPSADSY